MSTLPPPAVDKAPENSFERKAYDFAESLVNFLPVANDRNRLGFLLCRNLEGIGDEPRLMVKNAKFAVQGSTNELIATVAKGLEEIKTSMK